MKNNRIEITNQDIETIINKSEAVKKTKKEANERELSKKEKIEVYVVGGYVRDLLLGLENKKDIDMAGNIKVYGISGSTTSLILKPGYPTVTQIGKTSYNITYVYGLVAEKFSSLKPEWNAACPMTGYTDHSLISLSTSPIGPGLIEMTCTYGPGSSSAGHTASTHFDAQITKSVTTQMNLVPIDDPDLVTSGLYTEGQIASLKKHYNAVKVGGIVYQRTKYYEPDVFPWTADAITQNASGDVVCTTGTPTGLTGATANQWMFMSLNIRDDGSLVEVTEEWQFNKAGLKKS
jgi:hypothetical protein